ncbi:MAG TPA: amidohydrolase family protein [Vicinamibacteria bacterium]|nr:amidohydrolase family protein [Vicinamibacteria bacterium]
MARYTRSEFLRLSGASVAAGVLAATTRARAQSGGTVDASHPDLVLVNGRVSTMDESLPGAEAFAVKNRRFVAVGTNDDIRNLATSDTEVIDAEGQTVTPGFIDAHSHPASGGVRELVSVNLDLRSIDAIKDALRARASTTPPGEWVLGFKYDDTKVREDRQITREDLDEAVPNHPVFVSHRGGHVYWYNTKAFEKAGVDARTPDPPGGHIYKENGELTGKVAERANDLFNDVVPSGSTREERQAGVKLISELMTSSGLTSVHDASCGSDSATAYQDAYHAGQLRMRVYMMVRGAMFEGLKTAGVYTGLGNEWLKVGGVKFGADGSASGRTMAMSTPYEGRPDDFGILTMTQEEIHEAVEDAHRHDFQVGIHANGDLAIDMVLNAYERVLEKWPRPDARHRLEHCTLVNPDLLRRIKATGSIPTPFYTYVHYHGRKWEEYGPEKMKWMFAHRSFLDYGIPVAPASDYVPGPYEPMMAIQSMVTRKDVEGRVWGANQSVSVDEALRICTVNGAYASFEEDVKGSITAGKYADFVILGRDPREVDPDAIKEIPIVRTVVGGVTMHRQG